MDTTGGNRWKNIRLEENFGISIKWTRKFLNRPIVLLLSFCLRFCRHHHHRNCCRVFIFHILKHSLDELGGKERFWLSSPFKYLLTLFRFIVIIWSNLSAWRVKYDHLILLWYMNTSPEAFRAMWCERDTHTLSTHNKHFMFAQSNINNYVKYYTKSHKYPRICSLSITFVWAVCSPLKYGHEHFRLSLSNFDVFYVVIFAPVEELIDYDC